MAASDALPVPRKNTAYRITFPILDSDGDPVSGATGLDSEISKDAGTFADCTNEATEIATSSGMYYLDLTSTEMNADCVALIIKTSSSGAKTTPIVLYPQEADDIRVNATYWAGGLITAPTNTGVPNVNAKTWNDLATVALPLVPTTAGRTLDVSAGGEAGVDWANVGSPTTSLALTGTTIATTQKVDIETIKTNPVVNAGTVTFPTGATLASTTNITAGTITTVTTTTTATNVTTVNGLAAGVITAASISADAITDAKVASDVTIASVTGSVGSVSGNVDGNVSGSVASVVAGVTLADGSHGGSTATLTLKSVAVSNSAGNAVALTATGANGHGLYVTGNGSGDGVHFIGGATGHGLNAQGGATSGDGIHATATTLGDGIEAAGAGGGVDIRGSITGSLSGAVGSVTGNIGGNVAGSVDSVVSGVSLADDAITAAKVAASAVTEIQAGLSTLTQTQVTGGAYALNSASFAFNAGLDFTTTQKAATLARVTLTDTVTTYTGDTPQTGDSYAIVNSGTHGNAAIKGYVDDIGVAGAGLTALASAANLATANAALAKLDDTVEDNAGTYRFTTAALANGPSGGSAPTAVQIRQEMDSNSTQLAAIVADTNELQTDWVNGGRLDLILDATATQTSVNTIDDLLDTEVAAIKTVTDHLDTAMQLDGSVYRFTLNALELAPSGSTTVTLTPYTATVSGGIVSDSGKLTAYQHRRFGPFVITVVDADGDPVNLSAATLVFVATDPDGDGATALFTVTQESGDITVGGASNNVITIEQDDTNTGTALDFIWTITNTVTDAVVARGNRPVSKIEMTADVA